MNHSKAEEVGHGEFYWEDALTHYPGNLREVFVSKWSYKPLQVDNVIKKIEGIPSELQEVFCHFLEMDEFQTSPRYFGLSPLDIATNYTFKPPAVFLMMNWIRDEQWKRWTFFRARISEAIACLI